MKKSKKNKVICCLVVVFMLVVYLSFSYYLSVKAYNLIDASKLNSGFLTDDYNGVISPKNFERIYWGNSYRDLGECETTYSHTMPFTYFTGLNTAVTYYQYTGTITCENQDFFAGSSDVSCKIYWKFLNGRWVVSEYWEHV